MARLSFLSSIHAFREWSRSNLQARPRNTAVILSAQPCQQNKQPVSNTVSRLGMRRIEVPSPIWKGKHPSRVVSISFMCSFCTQQCEAESATQRVIWNDHHVVHKVPASKCGSAIEVPVKFVSGQGVICGCTSSTLLHVLAGAQVKVAVCSVIKD